MIYCPSCSAPWRGRGSFCGACGSAIDVEAAMETEPAQMPPSYSEAPETFRFGAPPPGPTPAPGGIVPIPLEESTRSLAQREPIALLQYWPVIVPGVLALLSGLLIVVQLIK